MNRYLSAEQMKRMEAANADASGDMELRREGRRARLGVVATVIAEASEVVPSVRADAVTTTTHSTPPVLPKIRRMPGNGSFA